MPLTDFTIEDLRIMIGQNISLDILIPLAIERLKQNIMAEGDCYPGDLLQNVLISEKSFWLKHPALQQKLIKLFRNNLPAIEKMVGGSVTRSIFKSLTESFEEFCRTDF